MYGETYALTCVLQLFMVSRVCVCVCGTARELWVCRAE
jgi:hypothetical protein